MSEVFSFAEESCWNQDQFRSVRKEVSFHVTSTGKIGGIRLDHELKADYAIFYDPEDEYLLGQLHKMEPSIAWGAFVFVKKMNQSGVDIIDPSNDKMVGRIKIRRSSRSVSKSDLSGERTERTVVSMEEFRLARDAENEN